LLQVLVCCWQVLPKGTENCAYAVTEPPWRTGMPLNVHDAMGVTLLLMLDMAVPPSVLAAVTVKV
jgi:hypothetical protein